MAISPRNGFKWVDACYLRMRRLVHWDRNRENPSVPVERFQVIDVFSPGKDTAAVRIVQMPLGGK